jgi:hypothetical protein
MIKRPAVSFYVPGGAAPAFLKEGMHLGRRESHGAPLPPGSLVLLPDRAAESVSPPHDCRPVHAGEVCDLSHREKIACVEEKGSLGAIALLRIFGPFDVLGFTEAAQLGKLDSCGLNRLAQPQGARRDIEGLLSSLRRYPAFLLLDINGNHRGIVNRPEGPGELAIQEPEEISGHRSENHAPGEARCDVRLGGNIVPVSSAIGLSLK